MKLEEIEIVSSVSYSLREVCERSGLSAERVIEWVDFGIIEPLGDQYKDWRFGPSHLSRLGRALRLQRDLDINLAGIALALDLLDDIEKQRRELNSLKRHFGLLD